MKDCELRITSYKLRLAKIFLTLGIFCGAAVSISAQSTSADFPTPITSNEISGTIRARDVGDARLTSYYYVFNGTQGDVFINVTANNFNGDIDVFAAEDLRPLSKIRLYVDTSPTETGRIVYLRQPLKLILRVEGRTPDDNPATFTIKFAGSFAAYQEGTESSEPALPKVESGEQGTVKVNSVGTIIEDKKEKSAGDRERIAETKPENESPQNSEPSKETATESKNESDNERVDKTESGSKTEEAKSKTPAVKNRKPVRRKPTKTVTTESSTEEAKNPPANPLENVHLIVLMKNGDKFEYPITEVFRFSLNNNVLTITLKDGKIERRSILDIQKFSVE